MLAKQEFVRYAGDESVRTGKYRDYNCDLHWHHDFELLYVEKGDAHVCAGGMNYRLGEKQAMLLHGGEAHTVASSSGSVIVVITFKNNIGSEIFYGQRLKSPVLSTDYDATALYDSILREIESKNAHYQHIISSTLLGFLINVVRGEKVCSENCQTGYYTVSHLLAHIDKNYAYLTAEDCSNYMGFSKTYFSGYFHKTIGITFIHYLNSVKVEKAIHLMRKKSLMSMTDIAMHSGFGTIRTFNRIFKEFTGYVPKQLPDDYYHNTTEITTQRTATVTESATNHRDRSPIAGKALLAS